MEDEQEPEEGDYTTEDFIKWWQYGKLVLTTADESDPDCPADDYKQQLKNHMEANRYWPNCWFISDHGNAHLLSLEE